MIQNPVNPTAVINQIKNLAEQFKHPSAEIPKLIEARQKDIETAIEATRTLLDGAQSLTGKQAQMLRQAVDELSSMLKQTFEKAGVAGQGARISTELLQQTVHTSLQSMSELAEICAKAQLTAIDVVAKRIHEHLEQWRRLTRPA
jgi:phasin family protein